MIDLSVAPGPAFATADQAAGFLRARGYRVTRLGTGWIIGLTGGLSDRELIRKAETVARSLP